MGGGRGRWSSPQSAGRRSTRPTARRPAAARSRPPWTPPPPWDTAFYEGDARGAGPEGRIDPSTTPPAVLDYLDGIQDPAWLRATRMGSLAAADAQLGRLLEGLQALGLLDRAVVAVTGSRGERMGPGAWTAAGPVLDPQSVCVPLVIRAPGRLPQGARIAAPVELTDLPATLAELAGVPDTQDGAASLVPLAFGRRAQPWARSVLNGHGVLILGEGDPLLLPPGAPLPDGPAAESAAVARAALGEDPSP